MNRQPIVGPYGGGNNYVKSVCSHAKENGFEVVHKFEPNLDAILLIDPRYDELGISVKEIIKYKELFPKTKVIHRVNECDARKGTHGMNEMLYVCSEVSDLSIFISNWLKDHHIGSGRWKCNNVKMIYNGVDLDIYKPNKKIENGKTNIVVHHWSDNIYKNEFTSNMDQFIGQNSDRFTFTYIGRAPKQMSLKNTQIIGPLYGKELGEELGKYGVYISSSLYDPGPNHITEALACKLPTYISKKGGGGVEMVGEDHVYSSFEEVEKILLENKHSPNEKSIQINNWDVVIKKYFDAIKELL